MAEKEAEWEEFRDAAVVAGLDEYADALVNLCVPSLRLKPVTQSRLRSRLGGLPEVPEGFVWPMAGRILASQAPSPMDFVGLLDLSEIQAAKLPSANVLPPEGTLAFFHGYQGGVDAEHCGSAGRVFYFGPRVRLAQSSAPPLTQVLPLIGLEPELLTEQLPPFESPFYALLLGEALQTSKDLYGDAAARFEELAGYAQEGVRDAEERPLHRVLGYADPLQADPYVNTEGNSSGAPLSTWHTLDTFRRAAKWRLLLQLDSDPSRNVHYGDGGVLAFMIRDEDLAARHFERTWVEWQSH